MRVRSFFPALFLLIGLLPVINMNAYNDEEDFSDDKFGIGLCIGKGAGLVGAYAYYRPFDFFAVEADCGARIFLFSLNDNVTTYFPIMFTGKVDFFFTKRKDAYQHGIELGGMYAQDNGPGAEISYLMKYRIAKNISLEADLGIGYFPDQKNCVESYLRSKGYDLTRMTVKATYTYVMLFWGAGISLAF